MEEKTGKADKKEIRSRKNQKLYRSRFGKGGKIMKKLEIVIRPESLETWSYSSRSRRQTV